MNLCKQRWFRRSLLQITVAVILTGCGGSHTPAPYVHYGTKGGADSAGVHTVNEGDTLWSIATRYKVSMQDVIYVNQLRPPYLLDVTQRLKVPPPNTYTVRPGDSLYSISRTFNVSLTELTRLNHLSSPYIIHSGDTLDLPSVRPVSVSPGEKPSAITTTRVSSRRAEVKAAPQKIQKKAKAISGTVPKRSSSKFDWPVNGRVISSYGAKSDGLHNDGINISASRHTPVKAAENGIVVYADNQLKGYGNLVLIRHENKWMTAYAHLENMSVSKGQQIAKGQSIGGVGSSGSVDTPQLHFEVRRGTNALNPKLYLSK